VGGYKNLEIWKESIELAKLCYTITQHFPGDEKFGMVSQINRCSVSISTNIAEGYGRKTNKDFIHFLHIALGSCNELDTLFTIAL
jgi:four helix bundle protein